MNTYSFSFYLQQVKNKGWMVYEYNPFHNFRYPEDTDSNGLHPGEQIIGKDGKIQNYNPNDEKLIKAGEIRDFDTKLLNLDLKHPVNIECQPSYDGSVNLILNDGKNIPRLINSRFSVLPKNQYEVVDRIGNNDTNIYDDTQFDQDTSLYKTVNKIPKLKYTGVSSGNLKVGNYHIYIKYADADDNETDFVQESGLISIFIGTDGDPFSVQGGIRDLNANKSINIVVTNIDPAYDYLKVYYTRETSDQLQNSVTSAFRIEQKYVCYNGACSITITGDEQKTEIPISEINRQYFLADSVVAQAQAQNMLFLGNVHRPDIDYADLQDISLRIFPTLDERKQEDLIGKLGDDYIDTTWINTGGEYYNTQNIYNYVGYWNDEIYRFGVVYILKDSTLSPVFNIRGVEKMKGYTPVKEDIYKTVNERQVRNRLEISEQSYLIDKTNDNAKGVVYIPEREINNNNSFKVNGIKINIPNDVLTYLQKQCGIKGMFFVRQKRIPTTLCQCYTLPMDPCSHLPIMFHSTKNYYIEGFLDNTGALNQSFFERLKIIDSEDNNEENNQENNQAADKKYKFSNQDYCGICPEYDLRQPYFNQLFTGCEFVLKGYGKSNIVTSSYNDRLGLVTGDYTGDVQTLNKVKIAALEDNMPLVIIEDDIFRGRAGQAEEAYKFEFIGEEYKTNPPEIPDSISKYVWNQLNQSALQNNSGGSYDSNIQSTSNYIKNLKSQMAKSYRLARGSWGPYLAIKSQSVDYSNIYDVKIPGYSSAKIRTQYFNTRYHDNSAYYPISDRISVDEISTDYEYSNQNYYKTFYRGDCYICTFTHRLNRNFNDPTAPTNDEIVDFATWRNNLHYTDGVLKQEDLEKINRGDVNAVQIGSWITLKVQSTYNLNIRSLDESIPDEKALMGSSRTFYPLTACSVDGEFKMPESFVINDGFGKNTGAKYYFTLPDVPYIKNKFDNRIAYSDIAVNDAFKNGYRVFQFTHYRDYPRVYGGLMKLVELEGNLIAVWEHGVGVIPVNERAVAGEGTGGTVFINTSNVLPENPKILSSMFGSQWPDSVIKTPYYIYGVDTIGKKIWRTNGATFEIISDFKVQKFLNDNISLSERELDPIIGIRNVKTHYNAYKSDVMFTFYDNIYGFEEKAWNLCYNELTQCFMTFYSWIPSFSENIDNIYFSFNRDTSKWISKLSTTSSVSNDADGITMATPLIDEWDNNSIALDVSNRILPELSTIEGLRDKIQIVKTFYLERDPRGNYKHFDLSDHKNLKFTDTKDWIKNGNQPVILLNIRCEITLRIDNDEDWPDMKAFIKEYQDYQSYNADQFRSVVAVTLSKIVNNALLEPKDFTIPNLTTDFWKHGQSGIIDIKEPIKPCYWYGKQHPFEYEFVVTDTPGVHKIFDNLQIIGNKAKPESFHYEITGECFDFKDDKPNMYVRQEATKDLYQFNGSDILYNRDFLDVQTKQLKKSRSLPLYYSRQDTYNEVEDYYKQFTSPNKDYNNLSGTEVVYYPDEQEFRLWEHSKAVDITGEGGRLRGNMQYKEDLWNIQINPIVIVEKNEDAWKGGLVPITVGNAPIPSDVTNTSITNEDIPDDLQDKGYTTINIDGSNWSVYPVKNTDGTITYADASTRQEIKVKDKYCKIRVRYTGNELAVIQALRTIYTVSYS